MALFDGFQDEFQVEAGKPQNYVLYSPSNAASFGSVNATVMQEIINWARSSGILLDPIYSAKLFYEAKKQIGKLSGNILLVHSGGQLGICGFYSELYKQNVK